MSAAPPLRALSFDYWDTVYLGAATPERVALRRAALRRLVAESGGEVDDARFLDAYVASNAEAERWWREEQRGYRAVDRIRWMFERLALDPRPDDCPHLARAVAAVDDALLDHPPAPLSGAVDTIRRLARRFPLAIISDTGFASGEAQDRLLERDGLLHCFTTRVYSCDVGHAKPHPVPFRRAAASLGVEPASILHVGDIERTDVVGALAAGFRAVRIDGGEKSWGPSAAEKVVRSWGELEAYLGKQGG